MKVAGVSPTISPSMDIQISSNFERLLFDVCNRDGAQLRRVLQSFRPSGEFSVTPDQHQRLRRLFDAHRFADPDTAAEIARPRKERGEPLDPPSATPSASARPLPPERPADNH